MLDNFTTFTGLGIILSLILFIILFKKWNLPLVLKKYLHINTKIKAFVCIIVMGIMLAIIFSFVLPLIELTDMISQILDGIVIGFISAVLVGLLNEDVNTQRKKRNTNIKAQDKKRETVNNKYIQTSGKSRRSKG